MLQNFFKTAIRFLWRNKSFTILNYLCLTLGLTCSIVAALNIKRVLNYDRFHKNYDRLYEVDASVTYFNGDRFPKEMLSASLPELLKANVPEIESISRITKISQNLFAGDVSFSETGIYADTSFLSVFTFPLSRGSFHRALTDNNSIVITERTALKFFKTIDCIGMPLYVKKDTLQEAYTVSAVLKDIPALSSVQFSFIIPFSRFLSGNSQALETGSSVCQVWALLYNSANLKVVNGKVKSLIKNQESTLNQELFFFPLKEKILYSYSGGRRVWREMQNIVIIASIGFAILLIACFIFINLSIAHNIKRFREVGIRKVVGARKFSIIAQHLGETVILTMLSLMTSIDLVQLVLKALNRAFNGNVQFNFGDFDVIMIFAGITFFTAIASGLLPALYLSRSEPVNVLKNEIKTSQSFSFFRQSLIVFQFTIPIVLIICMMIVMAQNRFFRSYEIGFDKDKMLVIPGATDLESHSEDIRNDLLSVPGIESVSFSSCIPAHGTRVSNEVGWEGKNTGQKLHFWCIDTDYDYPATVNLKISEGRYFDRSFLNDSTCYVINDVAARVMDYKKPIGRSVTVDGKRGIIIGVFTGFHSLDLAGPYTPTIISLARESKSNLLIRMGEGKKMEIIGKTRKILAGYVPDKSVPVILYSDLLKRNELTTVTYLVGLAFIISIMLACLGLSGLASFTAASRTKEIGIRKINGATINSILRLLGMNYSKWLLIASAISIPVAFLLGTLFLARFNFRTAMPVGAFIAGPVIASSVALLAVGLQSRKAAARNPVEALRYE
jgi:putative ABC transport system permease protein